MEHARPPWRADVLLCDHGVAGFETLQALTGVVAGGVLGSSERIPITQWSQAR
jgi:hypothetical protein